MFNEYLTELIHGLHVGHIFIRLIKEMEMAKLIYLKVKI